MLGTCLLYVYRFMNILLFPVVGLCLKRRVRAGKENPRRLPEKYGYASVPRPKGKIIWMHGASVGESLATLGLAQHILGLWSDCTILITSGTRTSAQILQRRLTGPNFAPFPGRIVHQMAPLDLFWCVGRFLEH